MTKNRTQRVRQAREKQRRRNQQRNIAIGVVLVAVIVLMLLIISNTPTEAPIPEGVAERYEGIEKGVSEEGYPMLGDPDAPVSVVEYSSFSCPTCAEVHDNAFPGILERVEAGQASVTYVPLPVAGRNVEGANRAAICMQEQGLFWEYHDTLFDWAQQFGNSPFTQNRLTAGAEALGADTAAFNSCVTGGETQFLLDSANSQAASQGIQSTPTLLVNGTRVDDISTNGILGAIDTAYAPFAGQEPEVEPTAEEIEPTPEEVEPTAEEVEPTAEEAEPTEEEAEPTAEDAEPTAEETEPTAEATESSD